MLSVNSAQVSVKSGVSSVSLASNLNTGATYSISVQSQPTGETCGVSNGSGTIATSNVANVVVSCTASTLKIGGTITGLSASGLVLWNNGSDATSIAANATQFVMGSPIAYAGNYSIAVKTPPGGETCQITQGSGADVTTDINSVVITCAPWHGFVETVLYSFMGNGDGADPTTGLIEGQDGSLYGTTGAGGSANGFGGTFFKITTAGALSVLHSFENGSVTDGSGPSGVIQGTDGNFYGVTTYGGATGNGTVFKITPTGTETILYSFVNGLGDGFNPSGSLIQATDGNLYGTASGGQVPEAGLIQGVDGNFYGTTWEGGSGISGTVFKLTPGGMETVLSNFNAGVNGYSPSASLLQASDGNLYGINTLGGAHADGTVFQVTPQGVTNLVYAFGASSGDGQESQANLIQASDGNFYGMTRGGGAYGYGTILKITPQ